MPLAILVLRMCSRYFERVVQLSSSQFGQGQPSALFWEIVKKRSKKEKINRKLRRSALTVVPQYDMRPVLVSLV